MTAAFILRKHETYLSVNWLEYFRLNLVPDCVERVRQVFLAKNYSLRPRGRFVVIRVETAKAAVKAVTGRLGRADHCPLPDDGSHACLSGYGSGDLAVALELSNAVRAVDSYAAVAD